MRYVAYAVDLTGVARAVYEIDCPTDKDAQARAERFLDAHAVVELWDGPRRVTRLARKNSDDSQGQGSTATHGLGTFPIRPEANSCCRA